MKNLKECTILLVDDAKANIDILFQALIDDYELGVAVDGESAIEYVKSEPPDLILLDIMMPDMDGYEVCQCLKNDASTRDIPIIFLTAMNELENKTAGFEAGAVDYITKPFEIGEVKARVKTHLTLKNALEQVNKYNKELEKIVEDRTKELIRSERQAAFSLMIQGIIHNLKNPLSGILGGAYLVNTLKNKFNKMADQYPVAPNFQSDLKKLANCATVIQGAGKQLKEMIDSMMAKSQSDKSDKIETINLNAILQQEIDFLGADRHFMHKIKKHINLKKEDLFVKVVPSEIAQVFQNLIRNSIHALWNQSDAAIFIESGVKDSDAWFSVADNGPGIPKDVLSRIFDPFFTTKPKAGDSDADPEAPVGTGLGLHTCLDIINSYKGSMEVDAKVGKGTKFIVSLPQS
ncbi:histidine kinase [Candidatus Magnetomoraceae bacterium gMMP-15]